MDACLPYYLSHSSPLIGLISAPSTSQPYALQPPFPPTLPQARPLVSIPCRPTTSSTCLPPYPIRTLRQSVSISGLSSFSRHPHSWSGPRKPSGATVVEERKLGHAGKGGKLIEGQVWGGGGWGGSSRRPAKPASSLPPPLPVVTPSALTSSLIGFTRHPSQPDAHQHSFVPFRTQPRVRKEGFVVPSTNGPTRSAPTFAPTKGQSPAKPSLSSPHLASSDSARLASSQWPTS